MLLHMKKLFLKNLSSTHKSVKSPFIQYSKCLSNSANDKVITNIDDSTGVATITMNNPPVNSLDSNFLVLCTEAINKVNENKAVKGIILTSNFNGKVFSAGLNILDMYQQSLDHYKHFWTCVQDWYLAWYSSAKPTVAAINGHAPAGGCAMSLMCDYRVMMEGKTIGLNETRLGIAAPFFFVGLIKNAIGHGPTEYALKTGSMYSSEEALKLGFVDQVTDLDSVMPTAQKEIQKLMAVHLPAFTATKLLLRGRVMEELTSIKSKDSDFFAKFISQDHTQRAIGMYLENLKKSRK